ncbi:MAG: hypothetical protein U9O85_06475 [Euryarchaeota archaeon]|nr:hypothetical protein [Euryarchaeota archaeon]
MTCKNITNGFCNENVHNIIEKMGQGRFRENFVGGLFSSRPAYSIFEGDECIQYLQEYVPFHLPPIKIVLDNVIWESKDFFNYAINILDVCSGPATVPLAFCKIPSIRYAHKHKFEITTVEPSEGFNNMINIFKATNTNEFIEIVNNLKYNLFDDNFMNDESVFKTGYNWVIIANSISAIGEGRTNQEVNGILNKFISKVLCYGNKVLLTVIEGGLTKYFDFINYLDNIERTGFSLLLELK